MFQIGEMVAYGATGVCTIEDIRMEAVSRAGTKKQEFYILRPEATPSCITYVPTANAALTAKLRPILTRQEIDAMIASVKDQKLEWIDDTRRRAEAYGQILSGGISAELLKLIACLYVEKKSRIRGGRKFSATDEKILSSAERMVSEEFSYALQIPQNQVTAYIAEKMEETVS